MRKVVMVTGVQAAGKATIGPLLAARLSSPAAALDGDTFYRMVVLGKVNMTPQCPPEAMRQVSLRYRAAALVAQHYADAGFDFVYTDIVLGEDVSRWMELITNAERHLVVLNPSAEVIAERELARATSNSYRHWRKPGMTLTEAIESMRVDLTQTPRRGLWLDTSGQTPRQTVEGILADGMRESRW